MRFQILVPAALLLAPTSLGADRHVVIVDLDGVRRDLLDTAYRSGRMPQLERLFGSPAGLGFPAALYFEHATTVAPSVTVSGQASLFTGVYPGVHGMPGDAWFNRDTPALIDYMTQPGIACVYGLALLGGFGCDGGELNRQLTAPTLYQWATAGGRTSVVVYNMYWKGATRMLQPSLLAGLAALQSNGSDLEEFDREMAAHAIAELRQNGQPDILTLYFAGGDAVGHSQGTLALMDYLSRVIDPLLGDFFDALEQIDPRWQTGTLFVVSADHGRTDSAAIAADQLAPQEIQEMLERQGFDPDHAQVVNQGGMAYVYLRPPGHSWSESPTASWLRAAGGALAADAALAADLQAVCYRDDVYRCLNRMHPATVQLLEDLNSRRTGDLILLAQPGRYFGNAAAAGSLHGALDATDLAVPLILAGGGIKPGRVPSPVSIVQVAATIAAYLGFAAENTQPALPGVVFPPVKGHIPAEP